MFILNMLIENTPAMTAKPTTVTMTTFLMLPAIASRPRLELQTQAIYEFLKQEKMKAEKT